MKIVKIFFVILLLAVYMPSCKKEGTGGKSSITGIVAHHGVAIPNSTVYIKYGATDFPGTNTGDYDSQVLADASGNFKFTELRKGDYYLYAVGYDASIVGAVSGGVAVKLRYNEAKTMDVPVTE